MFSASHCLTRFMFSRPAAVDRPVRSHATMRDTPTRLSSRAMAMPAAPAPLIVTRIAVISLPTTRKALRSAARTTIAVPC